MNVVHLTYALEQLQEAVRATFGPEERKQIQAVESALLLVLRRRGVFVGATYKTEERPEIEQIQDALDNYWRTQPDTLAAVNAVMKDVTKYRMEIEALKSALTTITYAFSHGGQEKRWCSGDHLARQTAITNALAVLKK